MAIQFINSLNITKLGDLILWGGEPFYENGYPVY